MSSKKFGSHSSTQARRKRVLELVHAGTNNVSDLADVLGVSEPTARRDLVALEASGQIIRSYGGAITIDRAREASLQERENAQQPQKMDIARRAAEYVTDGDLVVLDAGTTVGDLARLIGDLDITVVTNGMSSLHALMDSSTVDLIVTGGRLRRISRSFVGPDAGAYLRALTGDRVFLSGDGVVADRGICEASIEQASLKTVMINQARHLYVLADASKLGNASANFWSPIDRPWTLITDSSATADQLAPFEASAQCTVLVAEAGDAHRTTIGPDSTDEGQLA